MNKKLKKKKRIEEEARKAKEAKEREEVIATISKETEIAREFISKHPNVSKEDVQKFTDYNQSFNENLKNYNMADLNHMAGMAVAVTASLNDKITSITNLEAQLNKFNEQRQQQENAMKIKSKLMDSYHQSFPIVDTTTTTGTKQASSTYVPETNFLYKKIMASTNVPAAVVPAIVPNLPTEEVTASRGDFSNVVPFFAGSQQGRSIYSHSSVVRELVNRNNINPKMDVIFTESYKNNLSRKINE